MDNAFVMPYEDEQGNVYAASYWPVTFQGTDEFKQSGACEFTGWRDKATYLLWRAEKVAGRVPAPSMMPIPGAKRRYETKTVASYRAFVEWYAANPQHVYAVCQIQALQAQEIGTAPVGNAPDTRTSFFADATMV